MRLDKFLSNMGLGTRTEVKKEISRGNVIVNDIIVKQGKFTVKPDVDSVIYKNKLVKYEKNLYLVMNKPQGVISATEDKVHETVINLVQEEYGNRKLFAIGRLDIDTEGMILITDDGDFSHNLMSPKKHVEKTYYAKVHGIVDKETIDGFEKGITIGEDLCRPSILKVLSVEDGISDIELIITEGKFHQVKRMFKAVDMEVLYLKRIKIGKLELDENLFLGEYRKLTDKELEILKR